MGPAIAIGDNIHRHRKEARLTQDDLARHLGVTKASVSKWETGQSYPDVELLPRIAAYFDVTVDALMGYEPQMGKEGIRRECARLREAFATMPFDEAHAQCQKLAHDYYSCYPLLAQIAVLYLNHLDLGLNRRTTPCRLGTVLSSTSCRSAGTLASRVFRERMTCCCPPKRAVTLP